IIGTTVGLVRAEQARKNAVTAEQNEAGQRRTADEERAIAQAVNDFLETDLLGQLDLENQPGGKGADGPRDRDISVRTVLDRAARSIDRRFTDQPRVEGAIRLTIAKAYLALGHYKEAQLHADRSVELRTAHLGADHADTLTSKHALSYLYYLDGFGERGEPLCQEVLAKRTAALGPDHVETMKSKHVLALIYAQQGKFDLHEPLWRELAEKSDAQLGANAPITLWRRGNLAWVHNLQGKHELAETEYLQLIKAFASSLGEDHLGTLKCKSN